MQCLSVLPGESEHSSHQETLKNCDPVGGRRNLALDATLLSFKILPKKSVSPFWLRIFVAPEVLS